MGHKGGNGGGGSAGGQESTARARDIPFMIAAPDARMVAGGVRRRLRAGSAATLGSRVAGFFASLAMEGDDGAPRLLVGAIPFDRDAPDMIYQPLRLGNAALPDGGAHDWSFQHWTIAPDPDVAHYKAAVARALDAIARSANDAAPLEKIVLARSLVLTSASAIDPLALAARLAGDPATARFIAPLGPSRAIVGATPELLLSRKGDGVLSLPLAGSARRSSSATADRQAAEALDASAKDRREHALVVEAILDTLAPYCAELVAPDGPSLYATRTMWHLSTRIEGRLKRPDDSSSAELAAALHPTPAVGGTPRDRACELIHAIEGYDRGFYAGAVGWTEENGDGRWYVALRCAELDGNRARIHAGAGIVEGSDPDAEAAETSAKFRAMLNAFGIDESGRPLDEVRGRAVA